MTGTSHLFLENIVENHVARENFDPGVEYTVPGQAREKKKSKSGAESNEEARDN